MEQSNVYGRIHFLRELGQADKSTRQLLLRYITRDQMETLREVAGYIVNGHIRILSRDVVHFRERSLVLRQIIEPRLSLRRKRNALLAYQDVIPRLLRPHYLNRAVVLSIRSGEQ